MNTRTIYKRLYKSAHRNMWGIRSYASVILPNTAFTVAPPALPSIPANLEDSFSFSGTFEDRLDGSLIKVCNTSCGDIKPDMSDRPSYVEGTLSKSPYGYYKWWDSSRCFNWDSSLTTSQYYEVPYKEPWVLDYIKVCEWEYGAYSYLKPELYRLLAASDQAKSTYWRILPTNKVEVSFGVKPHYLRSFAPILSRAVKQAKSSYEIKVKL